MRIQISLSASTPAPHTVTGDRVEQLYAAAVTNAAKPDASVAKLYAAYTGSAPSRRNQMKPAVSLSAAPEHHVLEFGSRLLITLTAVEERPIKKSVIRAYYKDTAFVLLDLASVWNKGYPKDEYVCPTVEMISVPKKQQGSGLGKKLVAALLSEMKQRKIKHVMFDDYSGGFWKALRNKRVTFPKEFRGRIGYIDL